MSTDTKDLQDKICIRLFGKPYSATSPARKRALNDIAHHVAMSRIDARIEELERVKVGEFSQQFFRKVNRRIAQLKSKGED